MKKITLSLFVFMLAAFSLFSSSSWDVMTTKPFRLQAGYGAYAYVSVSAKAAQQNPAFSSGMPFNIEDSSVLYHEGRGASGAEALGANSGRLIADWHFLSNIPFYLGVAAEPLKPVKGSVQAPGLKYSLAFEFTLGYTTINGVRKQLTAFLLYDGNTGNNYLWYPQSPSGQSLWPSKISTVRFTSSDPAAYVVFDPRCGKEGANIVDITYLTGKTTMTSFIGSAAGVVYFRFTKDATNTIKNNPDSLPAGDYQANVTIYMKGV